MPAEYYSAPLAEVKPVLPAWMPWGCGSAALVVLLLMFAGSAALTGPRLATLFDLVLGMTVGELKGMYAAEVTPAQKESFDSAVKTLREGIRANTVPVQQVQPLMQAMQKAVGDDKVTPSELETLTRLARQASTPPQ